MRILCLCFVLLVVACVALGVQSAETTAVLGRIHDSDSSPAPGLRPDPSNEETGVDGRGTVGAAGVSGSQASQIHWCACPNSSLGSSRPSFTSEVPAGVGALLQGRIQIDRQLGPDAPAAEPRLGRSANPIADRNLRLGGGRCAPNGRNRAREP